MSYHRGNPPKSYETLETLTLGATEWTLYTLHAAGRWTNYKLASPALAERKANFWFAADSERLSRCRDIEIMSRHNPALLAALEAHLGVSSAGEMEAPTATATGAWTPLGRVLRRWDIDIEADPDGWDRVRLTPDSGGAPVLLGWNGLTLCDDDAWRALAASKPRLAAAVETFLQKNCN